MRNRYRHGVSKIRFVYDYLEKMKIIGNGTLNALDDRSTSLRAGSSWYDNFAAKHAFRTELSIASQLLKVSRECHTFNSAMFSFDA